MAQVIWILVVILQLITLCQGASKELLRNPNFTSPLSTSQWECNGCTAQIVSDSYDAGGTALLAASRQASWAGPRQSLFFDGRQVKTGGMYTFSCQVKLRSQTQKPQIFSVNIARTLQNGKREYTRVAEWRDVTMQGNWVRLVNEIYIKDYGPLKSMDIYVSGPEKQVDFLVDQCSLRELVSSDWRKWARSRIENIRKGDMTISVRSDKPLNNVTVKVEQLGHEFAFGSAVAADLLVNDAAYRKWYLENFEWAVFENAMKWRQNEWTQNRLTFDMVDKAMKILEDNGKKVRGHTVYWAMKERVPNWLLNVDNKTELYGLLEKRAKDVVGRYKGRLEHWDVNNEMLSNSWYEDAYGSKSIRNDMFTMVKKNDPKVKLFLNDYFIISGGQRHRMYVNQAQSFLKSGTPVDAVGAQCHFSERPLGPIIQRRLNRLATAGLPIWVTELDYADSDDQELADGLEDALLAFFSHPKVEGVLLWGFHAKRHFKGQDAILVEQDNTPNKAGLMWQRLFHEEWRTKVNLDFGDMRAGSTYQSKSRAFFGDYKIKISTDGKVIHEEKTTITKAQGTAQVNIILSTPVIG